MAKGPWVQRPGQDLLAQARSGLMWLNGDEDQGPVPFGLAVADMLAGAAIAQGILAALVPRHPHRQRRAYRDQPAGGPGRFPVRGADHLSQRRRPAAQARRLPPAHAYLRAPYGVYPTADGYLAMAMTPIAKLGTCSSSRRSRPIAKTQELVHRRATPSSASSPSSRDASAAHWLAILEPADIWCAKVLDWPALMESEASRRSTCCRR